MKSIVRIITLICLPLASMVFAGIDEQYAVPESPAQAYLESTPSTVLRPTTPKALGVALINAIDSTGKVQQGLAIDFTPWPFIPGVKVDLKTYQDSGFTYYALINSQISLATAKTSGDTASTDFALGYRFLAFDFGDPMHDRFFTDTLRARADKACPMPDQPGSAIDSACLGKVNMKLRTEWLEQNWNRASLAIGLATGFRLPDSKLDEKAWSGYALWLTWAFPLASSGQGLLQAKVRVKDSNYDSLQSNQASLAAKTFWGSSTFNAFLELNGVAEIEKLLDGKYLVDTKSGWSTGLEFLASQGFWISAGVGNLFDNLEKPETTVYAFNLKWGISRVPRITQP